MRIYSYSWSYDGPGVSGSVPTVVLESSDDDQTPLTDHIFTLSIQKRKATFRIGLEIFA